MRFRNFRVFSPKSGFVVLDQMNYLELELSLVLFMKVVRNVERKVLSSFGDNWGWPSPAAAGGGVGGGAASFWAVFHAY